MVDMEMSDDDQLDAVMPLGGDKQRYPYGLRICLTKPELDKLGLEADCEVGDTIDLRAFGTVTCVSSTSSDGGDCCRVEIQLEKLAVENEDQE